MQTILFICTGNTCRSPMAEGIARQHLVDRGSDVSSSRPRGWPLTAALFETIAALESLGIQYEGCSTPLTGEMIRRSHVLCMTASHRGRPCDGGG